SSRGEEKLCVCREHPPCSSAAAAGVSCHRPSFPGNFMEDEQWLSSISQYGGRIKHWNRFRDRPPSQP
uniref:Uncharacterized protein n=1 Tax=Calidris pygmaea TaxID=425635 RepID=A0A8C3JJC1_9CHAR